MKNFFTHNLKLKILALILAISLEIYFMSPQNSVTTALSIEVNVSNTSKNMMIVEPVGIEKGFTATIKLRGPGPLIELIKRSTYLTKIVVPENVGSSFVAEVDTSKLNLPTGVEIVEIEPAKIDFKLEKVARKEVPIKLKLEGAVSGDYELVESKIRPTIVVLRGPEKELQNVEALETEPIDISQLVESQSLDLTLKRLSHNVTTNVNTVIATLEIRPKMRNKEFNNLPIAIVGCEEVPFQLSTKIASIRVQGGASSLESLNELAPKVEAVISDCSKTGAFEEPLVVSVPEGVSIVKIIPEKVKVTRK